MPLTPDRDAPTVPGGAADTVRVSLALRGATAWSWRTLLVAGAALALGLLLRYFSLVTLPLCGAVLFAALLNPVHSRLRRHHWSRGLATGATILAAVVVIGGIVWVATAQTVAGYPALVRAASTTIDGLGDQVARIPGSSFFNVASLEDQAVTSLKSHASEVAGGALGVMSRHVGRGCVTRRSRP